MFGLSGLSKYLAVALVIVTGAGYVLFESLIEVRAENKTLAATNQAYVTQMDTNRSTQKAFEAAHADLVLKLQASKAQYKKDASREGTVAAKTALVRKLTNKKFRKQEREMACLTGNQSKC